MSYGSALEAAGATVLEFETFGSYQGDWWAKVFYNGKMGWVNGSFGACSFFAAFESEFGYNDPATPEKLAEFGKGYLDVLLTQEEAEKSASENLSWDSGAEKMVKFIKDNSIEIIH